MKQKHNRGFKGIWIPKAIWLDDNLKLLEKIFLIEIDSLDNEKGCFASNNYFAKFFKLSPQRCSQVINSLIKKNIVKARYEHEGKEIKKRVLNILDTYKENIKGGIKYPVEEYKENVKDSSIMSNNINSIYNYWNSLKLKQNKDPTESKNKSIINILKKYTNNEIKKAMKNYSIVMKDEPYFDKYQWTMENFLNREKGISYFLDDGEKWLNYINWKNHQAKSDHDEIAKRKMEAENKIQEKKDKAFQERVEKVKKFHEKTDGKLNLTEEIKKEIDAANKSQEKRNEAFKE